METHLKSQDPLPIAEGPSRASSSRNGDRDGRTQIQRLFDKPRSSSHNRPSWKSRKILALPRELFRRTVQWLIEHTFLMLLNFRADRSVMSTSMRCHWSRHPERADNILLKCIRLRDPRAERFGPWYLSRTGPEWELSQENSFVGEG